MNDLILNRTVSAFNNRNYAEAARQAAEGLAGAGGQDEAFWMGLQEACEGYALLREGKLPNAEKKLVESMRILRNFGFRYENFEVTAALAGIRRAVEEIRSVRACGGRIFDMSLLPQLRLAAKADD
ncbi:MAG: hypothetical protein ABIK96_02725 [bacterium]|nr:hypothetical protein [bacterium]